MRSVSNPKIRALRVLYGQLVTYEPESVPTIRALRALRARRRHIAGFEIAASSQVAPAFWGCVFFCHSPKNSFMYSTRLMDLEHFDLEHFGTP